MNWTSVQRALARAGYSCGTPDGNPGKMTWTALFAYAAGRQADAILTAIGAAAVADLTNDPLAATPQRLAEFLAQTSHETGGYTVFEEQLNYTAAQLLNQWPGHFNAVQAKVCEGDPKAIACRVYGGRNGNGSPPCADGWTYRGRGMLQLTGRNNYQRFGTLLCLPLLAQPDLAADPADSLLIAREFWREGNVNGFVDRGDFTGARKATNGGTIGLADVAARRKRLLGVLS
jgi:putative chitinase